MRPSVVVLLFSLVVLFQAIRVCNGDYDHNYQGNGDDVHNYQGNGDDVGDHNDYDNYQREINAGGLLKWGYYQGTCPSAETTVRDITWSNIKANPKMAAKLLRLHFHDCFVRGCEASILLNSTANNTAEKDAFPNLSLSGYNVIDQIKAQLEVECSGTVSCADIVALAARDAVSYQFQRPMWQVLTGRKDGKISLASDITANLPSPLSNFSTLLGQFQSKGLNVTDLVTLSGGHTIGVGHCFLILNRLYNFTGKGDRDPSLNPSYAQLLMGLCPANSPTDPTSPAFTVPLDPQNPPSFDSNYFRILNQNMGLFQSDAALLTDATATRISQSLEDPAFFLSRFAHSMKKMGAVGVIGDGGGGEVRKNCAVVN